jgi:hypothetical protein
MAAEKAIAVSESTLRQRRLRERDRTKGIRNVKLRCTANESNVIDAVSANHSMGRAEMCVTLFILEAQRLKIPTVCEKPEIKALRLEQSSEATALLRELVELTGSTPSAIVTVALEKMRATLF